MLCRVVGIIFILAVILICLPLSVPRLFGFEIFHVESGSMSPAIPAGSVIYVKHETPETLSEGDVITFVSEGVYVTHRIVENRFVEGELVTKGDANEKEDANPIAYANVVGTVKAHFPVLGKFLVVVSTGLGKFYLVLAAVCGVLFLILGNMLKKKKE